MKINDSDVANGPGAPDRQLNDILDVMRHVLPSDSIKAFVRRVVQDPSALERLMFHLGEPLCYHIKRRDSMGDEEMIEVRLLHRSVFMELEGLLKELKFANRQSYYGSEPNDSSDSILDQINHRLMEIFGDDMGEVSCGHSHDCCGCWFTRGYSVKFRGNLIRLKRYWYRNY